MSMITNNEELEALAQRLFPKFNEFLMRNSKNIFSCEIATSLDGILSMPALYNKDGVQKQVIAPLKLLTKDVDAQIEACKKATAACIEAATNANSAAKKVTDATADLDTKKKEVDAAVKECKTATDAANTATTNTLASKKAIEQNEEARKTAEANRKTAEQGRVDAENIRAIAETQRAKDFETAQTAVEVAVNTAVATDNQVKENENIRIQNETERQRDEANRTMSENIRSEAETERASAETNRVKAEQKRASDTAEALAASKKQTDIAKDVNDHPNIMGDNGNWWKWNTTAQQYEDTGIIARGGVMFPSFRHRRNKLLMLDYGSNIGERVARKRNKLLVKL